MRSAYSVCIDYIVTLSSVDMSGNGSQLIPRRYWNGKLDLKFHGYTFSCHYPSPPVHLLNNVITSLTCIKGRDSLGGLFLTPRSNASVCLVGKME